MIVYCPDWREKTRILNTYIKRLVELEMIQQIEKQLNENEQEYE
jgi:hypothetical protein